VSDICNYNVCINDRLQHAIFKGDQCLLYTTPKPRDTVTHDGRHLPVAAGTCSQNGSFYSRTATSTGAVTGAPTDGELHRCSDAVATQSKRVVDWALDDDDAANSTTSGSYVVNARELCNEIDEMFFTGRV